MNSNHSTTLLPYSQLYYLPKMYGIIRLATRSVGTRFSTIPPPIQSEFDAFKDKLIYKDLSTTLHGDYLADKIGGIVTEMVSADQRCLYDIMQLLIHAIPQYHANLQREFLNLNGKFKQELIETMGKDSYNMICEQTFNKLVKWGTIETSVTDTDYKNLCISTLEKENIDIDDLIKNANPRTSFHSDSDIPAVG